MVSRKREAISFKEDEERIYNPANQYSLEKLLRMIQLQSYIELVCEMSMVSPDRQNSSTRSINWMRKGFLSR